MGKRKSVGEMVRFSWKRNKDYDILLLSEVQSKNPFAFKNSKHVWDEISKTLQESTLQMKVTCRSCKDRVNDLLKIHRQNERRSNAASGISEPELTDIEKLLIDIDNLQRTGPNDQVRKTYAGKDRSEAESVRDAALLAVESSDSEDNQDLVSSLPASGLENLQADSNNCSIDNIMDSGDVIASLVVPNSVILCQVLDSDQDCALVEDPTEITDPNISDAQRSNTTIPKRKTPKSSACGPNKPKAVRDMESTASLQMFFNDEEEDNEPDIREDQSEKMITKPSGRKANSKQDVIRYLENKSDKELELRKDEMQFPKHELNVREKRETTNFDRELAIRKDEIDFRKEELRFREKELEIRKQESENKSKELDILHERTKGDIDNQKAITNLLMTLVNSKN